MVFNIYSWALASLATSGTLPVNDFASPAGYLTSALNSLIQSSVVGQAYVPPPTLPTYLPAHGVPWGTRTVDNTNPLDPASIPQTGVTRTYDFTIERAIIAPDGFNKSAILVNGQYPGPIIEANWGDEIQVTVSNRIAGPGEGTTLHFHGLTQNGTSWYDGTPGISQCPVAPGSSYTYKFRAGYYGTSWYHSHYSAQYTAGIFGPMIIHGPSSAAYDIDVGPVLIHDYYRMDYQRILQNAESTDYLTALLNPSDNTLIHGGSNYACPVGTRCNANPSLTGFTLTPGKRHLLRIINPSSLTTPMLFSIDNHTMTVVANDFTPIVPYITDVVSLASGQRTDVIVDATAGSAGSSFWMRIRQPDLCSFTLQPFGLAAVYYTNAAATGANRIPATIPPAAFNTPRLETCRNDPLNQTIPSYAVPAANKPDTILTITSNVGANGTGATVYTMNDNQFHADYNQPLLALASAGNNTYLNDPRSAAYDLGANRTIWVVFNNNMTFAHPMHLHGQQFQVLAEGVGAWDQKTITNPQNPQRRDTQIVQAGGYMVLQMNGNNPGVWPFHCHISWHLSSGMLVNLVTGTNQLRNESSQIQSYMKKSCNAWNRWSSRNRVDEIDSGD